LNSISRITPTGDLKKIARFRLNCRELECLLPIAAWLAIQSSRFTFADS